MIKWLEEIDRTDIDSVGGKAAMLGGLKQAGFAVPNGFVVLPSTTDDVVRDAFDRLGARSVAVRSSAVSEDGINHSWAGELHSFMSVSREQLLERIEGCRASKDSSRAQGYAKVSGTSGMVAVLVQAMVASEISGVAFSAHPVTGNREQIMIEAAKGLGELVVSGLVTPEHIVVSAIDGVIIEHHHERRALMSAMMIKELSIAVKKIEHWLSAPCDVEWAFEKDRLWVLQARPMTALPLA